MTPDAQRAITVAYQKLFATDDGVVVLEHLAKFCMERRSTYPLGDSVTDGIHIALKMAFNEGARTVILEIRRRLEVNLEDVPPTHAVSKREMTNA